VQTVVQSSSLLVVGLKNIYSRGFCIVAADASHPLCRLVQKSLGGVAALIQYCRGCNTEIHRCFERANQLLSLLVPVSDINRAAAGRVAAHSDVAYAKQFLAASFYGEGCSCIPNLPNPKRASCEV
jgi:hypothetical protein